jgi:peptide deformylase
MSFLETIKIKGYRKNKAMAILKILTYPNPVLRKKSAPITKFDGSIKRIARQMLDAMYKANGVGLAAIQVGKPIRLIVINLSKKPEGEIVLINPKLDKKGEKIVSAEGCLSLPGVSAEISRYKNVICRALNAEGKEFHIDTNSLDSEIGAILAKAFQHEYDHLEGTLCVDYLSEADKKLFEEQLKNSEAKRKQS